MADLLRRTAHPRARRVTVRYFLRASRASQIKNPIANIAKPTKATSCCTLARANENPVCAHMVWSSSAESGADHVHGDFKTQEHQIDDGDREYNLYAQHFVDLRLYGLQSPDPAWPDSAPVSHNVVASPAEQAEIDEQQPDRKHALVRLDVATGILMQVVRLRPFVLSSTAGQRGLCIGDR